jgi:predicted HNH restriction endonuclease
MGHEIIRDWLDIGDQVIIGNVGSELFALISTQAPSIGPALEEEIIARAKNTTILERAEKAKGKPTKQQATTTSFVRNPYVVKAVILRSKGKCEMPGCGRSLFIRDDGAPYLEVHHVKPLGEEGDDTTRNAAALCPHCHRELHFGRNRLPMREVLANYVEKLMM